LSYCTEQDLVDRFGSTRLVQLTDRVNKPASTIDSVMVARHIADAASLINSHLAKRYQLPLTVPAPAALTKVAVDLSWYFLLGDTVEKDSAAAVAYRDALSWLKSVASGTVVIEGAGEVLQPAGGGQVQTSAPNRVFTRDSLGDL
jgi:phage gp36-like protein